MTCLDVIVGVIVVVVVDDDDDVVVVLQRCGYVKLVVVATHHTCAPYSLHYQNRQPTHRASLSLLLQLMFCPN